MGLLYAFERDWVTAEREFQESIRRTLAAPHLHELFKSRRWLPLQQSTRSLAPAEHRIATRASVL